MKRMSKIKTRTYRIKKGLTKIEAWKKAFKVARADFRGMKYNPKTGVLKLT